MKGQTSLRVFLTIVQAKGCQRPFPAPIQTQVGQRKLSGCSRIKTCSETSGSEFLLQKVTRGEKTSCLLTLELLF